MQITMKKIILLISMLLVANLTAAKSFLVSTDWLAKNLNKPGILLIDMSDSFQYQRFHLPGAINLDYSYINLQKKGISLSIGQSKLIKLLGQMGITQGSHVVVYDDTGGLHASRLLWELEQLGHKNISILDGGLVKWIREGRKISAKVPSLKKSVYSPVKTGNTATATLENVNPATRNKNALLLDVRSEQEYLGNKKYKRTGHVPGARWWEWDTGVDFDRGFVMQNRKKLKSSLAKVGLKDKKQAVVLYCRSGHRASSAYLTLRELGFENVKLYDASMKEYEQYKNLPLKLGKEP